MSKDLHGFHQIEEGKEGQESVGIKVLQQHWKK